ncbi:hypothetical protein [Paractinoplanes globisporus]|uniref:Uncharacterized protein n=1 Tax=Paractinoplanes globisporus TaxID=113565 RepID=A0ABW6W4Q5_9ACTN|nr:hypothetical protein [Actinoplanes globisporus]
MKKPSKRLVTIIAIAALIIIAIMVSKSRDRNQESGLDAAGKQACDDFAAGYGKADTKTERLALADKVTASSGKTDNKNIQQRAAEMGNAAGAGGSAWKTAADNLTAACKSAGWVAP